MCRVYGECAGSVWVLLVCLTVGKEASFPSFSGTFRSLFVGLEGLITRGLPAKISFYLQKPEVLSVDAIPTSIS